MSTEELVTVSKAMVNFVQALVAILLGNAAYFLLLPHLPAGAHHVPFHFDAGLIVDFWFCLVILGIIKTIARARRRPNS